MTVRVTWGASYRSDTDFALGASFEVDPSGEGHLTIADAEGKPVAVCARGQWASATIIADEEKAP